MNLKSTPEKNMTKAMTIKKTISIMIYDAAVKYASETSLTNNIPSAEEIPVEYPDEKFGDYATPAAMSFARIFKKNPMIIASELARHLKTNKIFESIDVVKPGFINFRLSKDFFNSIVKEILTNDHYGSQTETREKILIEYVSANPTGHLHIGHGRWAAIGDSLGRVLAYYGHSVEREFYVNDAGNQIKKLHESVEAVRKGKEIPEDGYHGESVETFKNNDLDPVEAFLEKQQETLKRINSQFNRFFRESALHKNKAVREMIDYLKTENLAYDKDNALWFKTSEYGDEKDRVLVKSDGNYTYFAVDIAYHWDKIKRNYDRLINVFGADHHGYIGRLNAAVDILSKKKTVLTIIIGQLVNLFRSGEPVKMSKRTGDMITLNEVLDEIGVDAARWFLTMISSKTGLDFDIELAKQKSSDNPVYYVQYAHARICSVFKKAETENIKAKARKDFNFKDISSPSTRKLALLMTKFPDEIENIAQNYEIHHLNTYLYELASAFHKCYNETKFVRPAEYDLSSNYLTFLKAVKMVFTKGFDLLGISAPESM